MCNGVAHLYVVIIYKTGHNQRMNMESSDEEQMKCALECRIFSLVAHDVKTPLSSIIGALQVMEQMQSKLSDEQRSSLIHTALHEAHRLDEFFTALLIKAKPE